MRISKATERELIAHQKALRLSREMIEEVFDEMLRDVLQATAAVNKLIAHHNGLLSSARTFVEAAAADLRDEFDGKSERWQASDAGQQAEMLVDAWENAAHLRVQPHVHILEPDKPVWDESLNLPVEDNDA